MAPNTKIIDFYAQLKKKLISQKKDPYEAIPFSKMSREVIRESMKAKREEDRD
jgi:hypothetical protein